MISAVQINTLLADYPNTLDLKSGKVASPATEFDFARETHIFHGFKRVVAGEFDMAELAITTLLQAKAFGKPIVLAPAVIFGGKSQHGAIACLAGRSAMQPRDIVGGRVGIRASSQTTVMWVRGILQNDYGVDIDRVNWITFEDAHVAEYREPANTARAPAGKKLLDMLLSGEVDAAVLPPQDLKDPRVRPLIPDVERAAQAWTARNGFFPINHMLTFSANFAQSHPDTVRLCFSLIKESRKSASPPPGTGIDPYPYGVEANRKALETAILFARQQNLIPRHLKVDELFDDTTRTLA